MNRVLTQTGAIRARWAVLMVLATAVVIAGASIIYTNHAQRESDHRWCALLASLDQPDVPATTERGRQVQKQIHDLRRDLGCEAK